MLAKVNPGLGVSGSEPPSLGRGSAVTSHLSLSVSEWRTLRASPSSSSCWMTCRYIPAPVAPPPLTRVTKLLPDPVVDHQVRDPGHRPLGPPLHRLLLLLQLLALLVLGDGRQGRHRSTARPALWPSLFSRRPLQGLTPDYFSFDMTSADATLPILVAVGSGLVNTVGQPLTLNPNP